MEARFDCKYSIDLLTVIFKAVLEVPKELENEILRKIINNWIGTDFDVEAEMREIYSEMLNNSQE